MRGKPGHALAEVNSSAFMALIQCPECSREVSDRAVACPDCGFPIAAEFDQGQESTALVADKEQPDGALEVAGERTARIMRTEVAQPLVEVQQARMKQEQDKSSGGCGGAFLGALLGLVLFFAACHGDGSVDPDFLGVYLFFASPFMILGALLGYVAGKAAG